MAVTTSPSVATSRSSASSIVIRICLRCRRPPPSRRASRFPKSATNSARLGDVGLSFRVLFDHGANLVHHLGVRPAHSEHLAG